ncbi:MAG: hypothetical protein M1834_008311 [Cirrosporium novae-zelandiae]|nr:MAG: hypothetical protein M1834_008311 [Cirrosporium novae-zelandiae]
MSTQQGIIVQDPKNAAITTIPLPTIRPGYMLVKTIAVALNPTDWKHIDYIPCTGAVVGCDYAGIVVEVGPEVTKPFKKGDRVFGMAHGANALHHENGTFAEYIVVKGDVAMRMPEGMKFEDVATFGVGTVTVGQALYQTLKLPLPTEPAKEPFPLLIYGGSTATGMLAIQFAKLYYPFPSCNLTSYPTPTNKLPSSNLTVITTCSPRNFDLVKSLGATAVFDYNDPSCGSKINAYTHNTLQHVFDCISLPNTIFDRNSLPSSVSICCTALSSSPTTTTTGGCHYSSLQPIEDFPRKDIINKVTFGYTAIGERCLLGKLDLPVSKEDFEFWKMWSGIAEGLIAEGKVRPVPTEVGKGLEGVLEGLQRMREGKVSGRKLVYRIGEEESL